GEERNSGFVLDASAVQACNRSVSLAERIFGVRPRTLSPMNCRLPSFAAGLLALLNLLPVTARPEPLNSRRPQSDADLRFWLENMVWYHRFSLAAINAAVGLSAQEIIAALAGFEIGTNDKPKRFSNAPLLVLPYPGGRHPRIGFLDGAVNPQRDTKVSVFTPWDE